MTSSTTDDRFSAFFAQQSISHEYPDISFLPENYSLAEKIVKHVLRIPDHYETLGLIVDERLGLIVDGTLAHSGSLRDGNGMKNYGYEHHEGDYMNYHAADNYPARDRYLLGPNYGDITDINTQHHLEKLFAPSIAEHDF